MKTLALGQLLFMLGCSNLQHDVSCDATRGSIRCPALLILTF